MSKVKPKVYDQDYFEHWYRGDFAQDSKAIARKVAVAVAIAEHHLGRPIRSILDIGCGEAPWRKHFLKLRPTAHYQGVDSSEYVVQRYGKSRNIVLANFGQMQQLRIGPPADLLVCSDVLHYVPSAELKRGLQGFAELCAGIAYIDVYCHEDKIEGDFKGFIARSAKQYRILFEQAGFIALGSHCYLSPQCESPVSALEHL
jgi:SAM-dependent methyltransferase